MAAFNKNIHLCPGTFLTLLMKAKNEVATAHEKEKGISYSNSDDDVFAALLKISFPDFVVEKEGSFHTFTNQYKQCGKEAARSIPLANENAVEGIRKNQLNVGFALRMQQFIKTYLKETELNWLINALVDLMDADPLISDKNLWYMGASFQRETSTLRINDSIYVDWFLASVWYYIITECKYNKIEKEVYDSWFAKEPKDKGYEFVSNIGKKDAVNYKIQWYETSGTLLESAYLDDEEDEMDDLVRTEFRKDKPSEQSDDTDILYESSLMQGKLWQRLENGTITPKSYNSEMSLNEYAESEYYEFNEKCSLKTVFIEGEKTIEVVIHANGFDIVGYTSGRNWTSDSSRNRAVGKGTHNFKGIFKVEGIDENSISVQYLYLGEVV